MEEVTLVSRVSASVFLLGAVLLVPKTPRRVVVGAVLPRDTVRAGAGEEQGTNRSRSVVAKRPFLLTGILSNGNIFSLVLDMIIIAKRCPS